MVAPKQCQFNSATCPSKKLTRAFDFSNAGAASMASSSSMSMASFGLVGGGLAGAPGPLPTALPTAPVWTSAS
eukprot:9198712-Prorocentrum_lima.AAC.1